MKWLLEPGDRVETIGTVLAPEGFPELGLPKGTRARVLRLGIGPRDMPFAVIQLEDQTKPFSTRRLPVEFLQAIAKETTP